MSAATQFPVFTRKGVVASAPTFGGWSKHMQMPTVLAMPNGEMRIFYSARDADNHSHVLAMDVEPNPPFNVKRFHKEPVLSPGALGCFDHAGVMPTAVIDQVDCIWLYYIGWSLRQDVPYHNAIGVARSYDGGRHFERFCEGPIVGTGPTEPYFCGTADVFRLGQRWSMIYMSSTGWRMVNGKAEPRYHLKQCFSNDGIVWDLGQPSTSRIAIDYENNDEGGIARATVFPLMGGKYGMLFCYRGISDYRGCGQAAYRLGLATSTDGVVWMRHIGESPLKNLAQPGAFDDAMECYPFVHAHGGSLTLFYNGNDFGQTGIGFATVAYGD